MVPRGRSRWRRGTSSAPQRLPSCDRGGDGQHRHTCPPIRACCPGRPGAPSWWGGRACRRPPMLLRWLRRPERRRRRGGPTGVPQGTWTNQGVRDEVGATHWPLRGSASPARRSTATSLPMGAPARRSTAPREGGDDSAQAGPAAQVTPDPSIRGQREQTDPHVLQITVIIRTSRSWGRVAGPAPAPPGGPLPAPAATK